MKTLYLDLPMGAAGDMLSAALYELMNEEERNLLWEIWIGSDMNWGDMEDED